jgi:hypothetical protein
MLLPEPSVRREPVHTRRIVIEGYQRDDGWWDIEGHLTDVRHHDLAVGAELREAGTALHEMLVRICIDDSLTILSAEAETLASPYPDTCGTIAPAYASLVGVRIEPGFRRQLGKLFGGLRGCTHITELLGAMATVAMQTVGQEPAMAVQLPPQLDGCHALDTTGPVVARYYPNWHRPPE